MTTSNKVNFENNMFITEKDIKIIISNYSGNEEAKLIKYTVNNASNKMLGFLAEYWKIKVYLSDRKTYCFFVKAISRTNTAKAKMVKDMKLFNKETWFYVDIKKHMEIAGIEPWSARLITVLHDALVFEDLNALQYRIKNKFERFDMAHTLQALKTLARFHASSIIFEEKNTKDTQSIYKIKDEYEHILHKGGYYIASEWYIQCMTGALEAIKSFSKYDETEFDIIRKQWYDIWSSALKINDCVSEQRKVICHRDLWNNNIMFHYKEEYENELIPDNCLLVDFQAVRYQPPASDVMLLLCCNLDPKFREENINIFLNFYYEELKRLLGNCYIQIDNVLSKEDFIISANEQTKWGLIICACLMPQFWIDDDLTTKIFCDGEQFEEILCKDKGLFIKKMMQTNTDYRQKVLEIFEEIVDRYCFKSYKKNSTK